jgi:hypothetical protein
MVEYLIGCATLVIALLVPWDGTSTVLAQLVAALRAQVRTGLFLLALY